MTPLDFRDLREGRVYLSWYPKWPRILRGYFPFTVSKLSPRSALVVFQYPVSTRAGVEFIKGDEPAILFQDPHTREWFHYGATALDRAVPISVGALEGPRRTQYEARLVERERWLASNPGGLRQTKYPLSTDMIEMIARQIRERFS